MSLLRKDPLSPEEARVLAISIELQALDRRREALTDEMFCLSKGETYPAMDTFIQRALKEHRDWHEYAMPSVPCRPRVSVEDHGIRVSRRPFRRHGEWCVRWAGTARLSSPREVDGQIVFTADWGRRNDPDDGSVKGQDHGQGGGRG